MIPILALTLTFFSGHPVFAAELNIPYLDSVVVNEISKSVKVNLDIASDFKNFDKSTFAETAKILPVQLDKTAEGFKVNAILLNAIIPALRSSSETKGPGNVYIPEETLNEIERDIANTVIDTQNLYAPTIAFTNEFKENAKNIHLDSNGCFTLPPNVGPKLMNIKAQLVKNFQTLSVSCLISQNILHQVALNLKSENEAGAKLFEDASIAFAYGVTAYANVSDTIHTALLKFIELGMNIENETLHIPANKFVYILNTEMNGTARAFEKMAEQVNSVGNQILN